MEHKKNPDWLFSAKIEIKHLDKKVDRIISASQNERVPEEAKMMLRLQASAMITYAEILRARITLEDERREQKEEMFEDIQVRDKAKVWRP